MNCFVCQAEFDTFRSVEKDAHKLKPGDLTVCFSCGTLYIFDPEMRLIVVTKEMEAALWWKDRDIMKQVSEVREFIKRKIVKN